MRKSLADGIFTIAGVFTEDECRAYIDWSEGVGYEAGPVSLAAGAAMRPDVGNDARVMVDAPERTAGIWSRLSSKVPPFVLRSDVMYKAP